MTSSNSEGMPHRIEESNDSRGEEALNENLMRRAAHLLREQEMFLRDLEAFSARLSEIESKFNKRPSI